MYLYKLLVSTTFGGKAETSSSVCSDNGYLSMRWSRKRRNEGKSQVWFRVFPLLSHCPYLSGAGPRFPVARAEALRFGSKLTLFHPGVWIFSSLHWNPPPEGSMAWNQEELACVLGIYQAVGCAVHLVSETETSDVLPVKALEVSVHTSFSQHLEPNSSVTGG